MDKFTLDSERVKKAMGRMDAFQKTMAYTQGEQSEYAIDVTAMIETIEAMTETLKLSQVRIAILDGNQNKMYQDITKLLQFVGKY